MALTAKERARKSAIVHQLCDLSRNGWAAARSGDYQPLERELEQLTIKENRHA